MKHEEITGLMRSLAPTIGDFVAKAMAPLRAENTRLASSLEAMEQRFADLSAAQEQDRAGVLDLIRGEIAKVEFQAVKELDPLEISRIVAEKVGEAISAIPLPVNGKDAEQVDPSVVANLLVDLMPVPADGKSVTVDEIKPLLAEMVAALPPAKDGKDADPEAIRAMVIDEVAKHKPVDGRDGEPGKDGVSVSVDDLVPVIEDLVQRKVSELPPPVAGEPGQDGKSVTIDDVRPVLEELVAALPPAQNGKDADPAEVAALIVEDVAKLIPVPADGKSVSIDDVLPAIEEMVEKRVSALPRAKDGEPGRDGRDGVGVAGALINRDGELVLTLSDGTTKGLGVVVGRDADMGALEATVKAMVDAIPRPKDGLDGVGFDDLDVKHDGERKITLRFARGDNVKEYEIDLPGFIDRGVWKEGKYVKGDGVTWGGCFYIAQKETAEKDKPGTCDSWRMSTKKGRDGQDGRPAKGILDALINADGHLVIVFTDGTKKDVGKVVGKDGKSWV